MKKYTKKLLTFLKTPHGFFAVAALLFGGLFIVIVPPLQTPDEAAHFLRAYQVSDLKLVGQRSGDSIGSDMPKSIQKTIDVLEGGQTIQTHRELKYKLGNTKAALFNVPFDARDTRFIDTTVTASYSPIGYIPQALGIKLVQLVGAPPIVMLYTARLFVLVAWIGMVIMSIKIFPFKKWAIVGIALLPMFVSQSISLGVDVVAIGTGLLFTSLVLRALMDKTVSKRTLLFILLAGVAMVLSKQVMAVLLPLVLLIKSDYLPFTRTKSLLLKLAVLLVPIVFLMLWTVLLPDLPPNVMQIYNHQDTAGQMKYLLHEPWMFIVVLFKTFFFNWGDGIFQSLMGNFGWLDTPLSGLFIQIGYGMLVLYLVANYEKLKTFRVTTKQRIFFAAIALMYFLAVCAAMYVLYSPVRFEIIIGIQGRYLFPCLFLLVPALFSTLLMTREKYYARFTQIASCGLLLVSTVAIIFRFYLHVV